MTRRFGKKIFLCATGAPLSWKPGKFFEPGDDFFEAFVERRGSSGDAYPCDSIEPLWIDVVRAFNVVGFATQLPGGAGELGGVVGIFSSDCEDQLGGVAEFMKRGLPVFGGVADGVEISNFDIGSLLANFVYESANAVDGLGGLRDDANSFYMRNGRDVFRV